VDKILKKIQVLNKSLIQDFQIRKPKIAVLGLNPHAGDNGIIGNEEQQIIIPAINKAKEEGVLAYGPYPADGFFGNSTYKQFDAVLAMYHDQGLIPFKTISFNSGVNFTAGLPIVRTSPDHGTAYDIAGKNHASEESFRKAIYTAVDIYRTRRQYGDITANPLKINPIKRER
jgi:4-hydroxythreonine-4-phosphate dehydrogenase